MAPAFQTGATGIALDQRNGSFGFLLASTIGKGFNPTNPHLGDAIVATFFWVSTNPTNLITRVHDVLANGMDVGNTYTAVEFVNAGGVSMATYVATNVQNFPDPCCAPGPDQANILVVLAELSEQVSDGGVMLSAYTGVAAATPDALGSHLSSFGSGSGPTTAAPGEFAVGAGGLAYGVTMANSVVGIETPPAPFSMILQLSNAVIKADGEFAVLASAGTVNPQWIWHFEQLPIPDRTWLATGLSLNPVPVTGDLTVSNTTTGSSFPASFTVTVDAGTSSATSQEMAPNASITFTALPAGGHSVTLTVASNCTVTSTNPVSVSVTAGETATASFTVTCTTPPTTGNLTVSNTTTGSSFPASYTVTVDAGTPNATSRPMAPNASITFIGVPAGGYSVTLTVASNCTVSSTTPNPQTVNVPAGGTGSASFTVSCTAPPTTGNLMVSNTTMGSSFPASFTVTVDAGTSSATSQAMAPNGSVTFMGIPAGGHSVTLTVASNCMVTSTNPVPVNVPAGGTASASFSVSCTTPTPPPKATGGGRIDPSIGKTSFGFNVDGRSGPPFQGQLEVVVHGGVSRMTRIKSLVIDGVSASPDSRGGVCVTWSGSAQVSNTGQRRYTATACDNGQPGSSPGKGPDRFGISVDGSVSTGLTDLTGGNTQAHQ